MCVPLNIVSPVKKILTSKEIENARILRLVEFDSWDAAQTAGYRTRNQWRKRGKGVRDRSLAYIHWKGERRSLYHRDQTTALTAKSLATDSLIDRFVGRTDIFGYQPHASHDWRQMSGYRWNAQSLIRQGFNHRRCHDGIPMGNVLVQAFSVRCGETTGFFVIDVDCHHPTAQQIPVHLQLVKILQTKLPGLVQQLGGGSIFCQYRQVETSGIQFWVTLTWQPNTSWLHAKVREFLAGLDAGLDRHLREVGLPGLGQIEIKPTETQQVSMPGCYGKTVFTDREVKLLNGWFDVVALNDHIQSHGRAGEVLPRYEELLKSNIDDRFPPPLRCGVRAELATAQLAERVGPAHPAPSRLEGIIPLEGKDGCRYWTDLKQVAVEGVTIPDRLYEEYLQPLGQCLYFRDFAHQPDRASLVEEELVRWVMNKHNGLVSRSLEGSKLRQQCRTVVKRMEKTTCQAVKNYYRSILMNDLLYPHCIEHLYDYMRSGVEQNTISMIYCKCSISQATSKRPLDDTPLPSSIAKEIEEVAATLRKGKVRERFTSFARRFLNEVWSGEKGEKNIHWQHINAMMGKPGLKSRQTQDRYKKLLLEYGIIKGGWEKFIRRGSFSSRYRLTRWALNEFGRCLGREAAAGRGREALYVNKNK